MYALGDHDGGHLDSGHLESGHTDGGHTDGGHIDGGHFPVARNDLAIWLTQRYAPKSRAVKQTRR
ncbi:hypothetical protein [Stieleria varia]|uniref:hypothetical protein n=1 Tax=Stieleria varia TaxID=2528005 RepID=UPI001E45BEBF|nr:hypothetical protein [Stieleria varia]